MSILDEIIDNKKKEVELHKKNLSIHNLQELIKINGQDEAGFIKRDFYSALSSKDTINIIAEIKKASPSKGTILEKFRPAELAHDCEMGGASAISVLTDEKFFKGKLEHLNSVRAVTEIPLLRKDFIIDEYQIIQSKWYGADAILLIGRILEQKKLEDFISISSEYNIDILYEVHDKEDITKGIKAGVKIFGVNNRDLTNFEVDHQNVLNLSRKISANYLLVSESGIQSKSDIDNLYNLGINNFLIGESIMKAKNRRKFIEDLRS
ncbi:MAG TPA: indole-3-glycerol phosphate synthase TrpC [Candidatus Dadabacteria bacterium]|jgi:indole-3-glycerol phosphate synthase|nr:indole-3-glycerol phosphate synthase TrpC [Candidatus Dadabacteria bacterium]